MEGNEEEKRQNQNHKSDDFLAILNDYSYDQHKNDLIDILLDQEEENHFPVVINTMTVFDMTVEAGERLLGDPENTLITFDKALVQTAFRIYSQHERKDKMIMKRKIHARFTGLPLCPEMIRNTIPTSVDLGSFLCIQGTVIRITGATVMEFEKEYFCNKCKSHFLHKVVDLILAPKTCPTPKCTSTNFKLTPTDISRCRDHQEIKIINQAEKVSHGNPRSISIVLEDDLIDSCKPGDDVEVSGIVMRKWHSTAPKVRTKIEIFLKANYVHVNNNFQSHRLLTDELREEFRSFWEMHRSNALAGRNLILESFCPQVYGLYLVKLAVAVILAGGVAQVTRSGTHIRGDPHLLLVGDPGTSKSQFLKYTAKINRRSILTTGTSCSGVGLTVTAIRDGGQWSLEAGALVLADGGVCCVDEFSKMRENDKKSLLEVMEQQCINVAKGGIVCRLNTRCSIIASTNLKRRYDVEESIDVNVGLGGPLLSRFDLILVLVDTLNSEWEKMKSTFILHGKNPNSHFSTPESGWNLEKMQAYFCLIRTLQPTISDFADRIITAYYRAQRRADSRNVARTTVRLLESHIRLAQGHARLMFRDEVTVEDAVVTIALMETSAQGAALIEGLNALHSVFPEDPRQEYMTQAQIVLNSLGLHDILEHEISRLDGSDNCQTQNSQNENENETQASSNSLHTTGSDSDVTEVSEPHAARNTNRSVADKLKKFAFTSEITDNETETSRNKKRKKLFNPDDDDLNESDFSLEFEPVNKKTK